VGVTAEIGVIVGVEAGVPLRNAESFRLDAGEAGAEPIAPAFLSQEFLLPPFSASVGESNSPGESNTTGTRANCSVGIRIWKCYQVIVTFGTIKYVKKITQFNNTNLI